MTVKVIKYKKQVLSPLPWHGVSSCEWSTWPPNK